MLKSVTNDNNPLMKNGKKNEFATHCLHLLRVEEFSKAQREQIMQGRSEPETTVPERDVLALKVKVMQHPAIYEGMRFKDLVKLADTLAKTDKLPGISLQLEHLALLKELTRLIFV
jgi:nucleolar pre-ribosomal-associated protein 2